MAAPKEELTGLPLALELATSKVERYTRECESEENEIRASTLSRLALAWSNIALVTSNIVIAKAKER